MVIKRDKKTIVVVPIEIAEDILLKLPVKSLIRFKCVSKHWYSLLNCRNFGRAHLNHNLQNYNYSVIKTKTTRPRQPGEEWVLSNKDLDSKFSLTIIESELLERLKSEAEAEAEAEASKKFRLPLLQPNYRLKSVNFSFTSIICAWEIKCSCDGILCIVLCDESVFLWNPRTNDYKVLPKLVFLPDNQRISMGGYGFGFDSTINDYKVVAFQKGKKTNSQFRLSSSVYVLTLKCNVWKKLQNDFPYMVLDYNSPTAISLDGGLYWYAWDHSNYITTFSIIHFELANEIVRKVPPPNFFTPDINTLRLTFLQGCLSLSNCDRSNGRFDVWVMKDKTWMKLINMPLDIYNGPGRIETLTPLCFTKDGAFVMQATTHSEQRYTRQILIYDAKHATCKQFHYLDIYKLHAFGIDTVLHVDSLLSPST